MAPLAYSEMARPEEIRTPDPQIRRLVSALGFSQLLCKPNPIRPGSGSIGCGFDCKPRYAHLIRSGVQRATLPLGREYVAVAVLCQRAGVRHQPVRSGNHEFIRDRAIKDLLARFDGHLRVLVDGKLPLRIGLNVGRKIDDVGAD